MNDEQKRRMDILTEKVNQHEKTITQLVQIIGLTNQQLTEIYQLVKTNNENQLPQNQIISTH